MRDSEPALLEMSFTVIITEGTKPAYEKGENNGGQTRRTAYDGSADEHDKN